MNQAADLRLLVPGSLDQPTGGYRYDAQMVAGLRARGWSLAVDELEGDFPGPSGDAEHALEAALAAAPDGQRVLVDGLAGGAFPEVLQRHARRLRLIALVHHPLGEETGLDARRRRELLALEHAGLAAAEGIVTTSAFTSEVLAGWGVESARLRVVPPGVERHAVASGPAPGAPPGLLAVGALIPRKGQQHLLAALAGLTDRPWHLVLAGPADRDPTFVQGLHRQVEEGSLQDRVSITGACSEAHLAVLYDAASLFVLPSEYEGFGMVFTEAMARGLPVVTTTGGAIPYTVPAAAGERVPPGDIRALREALARFLDDPQARRAAGMAGREAARRMSDWPASVEAMERALRELAP
ncbi:glycosyltransferase family 4 protein [Thioalkalivibrio sp. ALJ24]|uniref:glycosyltransferase family 4 protein n=1 Tax=Thioalkalivibrio sp. ALJ24 TaxID=545276 RepID=UPI00037525D0|nr:glycosyltransferase family 4 protein [Thioalkalivibrio sp. ALJ24]